MSLQLSAAVVAGGITESVLMYVLLVVVVVVVAMPSSSSSTFSRPRKNSSMLLPSCPSLNINAATAALNTRLSGFDAPTSSALMTKSKTDDSSISRSGFELPSVIAHM